MAKGETPTEAGSPNRSLSGRERKTLEERFREKTEVDHETGCINWTGAVTGVGYGNIGDGAHTLAAHRLAYQMAHGPIPDGLLIRHTCDNRRCVNPAHLVPGTKKDNADDMVRAGRAPKHTGRTLSDKDVATITGLRILGWLQKEIASEYNVSLGTVQAILNNRSQPEALEREFERTIQGADAE